MDTLIPSTGGATDLALEPIGPRTGADVGDPQMSIIELYSGNGIEAGVWECTPGGWHIANRSDHETVVVVSGRGTITDADGTLRQLVPGAVVNLPKGWSGRWDITETLRKVYITVE
jgi:uncharacterized cupin superfamily protein